MRRILLFLPVLLVLLFAGVYLLAGAWLESSGGRQAIERELSRRLGMPVSLRGDFSIALLPSVGVAGTDLVIGGPTPESEVGRSEKYSVELAVLPLLNGEFVVESFRLVGGRLYPERLPRAADAAPNSAPALLRLPEVESFSVRDFAIVTGTGSGNDRRFLLQEFELHAFAAGREAPFRLAVEDFGVLAGRLDWNAQAAEFALDAAWSDLLPGSLRLKFSTALASGRGRLQADWSPPGAAADPGAAMHLVVAYELQPAGLRLSTVRLAAGPQAAAGEGCLVLGATAALHLDLEASHIDLDALPDLSALAALAALGGTEGEGQGDADAEAATTPAVHLRLRVAEARAGGVVARAAVLRAGAEPDCSELESAEPG